MNELEVLKKQLPEMASIMNALPGNRFDMKSAQTILIVQRRMAQSELSKQLGIYAQLLSKNEPATMDDLVAAAVAYVRIKTLVEGNETEYSPMIVRELIKEYKTQQTKLKNILRLSKVNVLTAESYQRVLIEKTIGKSESFLSAFEKEIAYLEEKIDKEPKSLIKPKEPEPLVEDMRELSRKKRNFRGVRVPRKIVGAWDEIQKKNHVTQELKEEEARYASSRCREVPFYDSTLKYSDKYICKDIPAFSLYKRRESIYFGKTENGAAGIYNNRDKSLFELMSVNEDFVQFMTTDLLTGEYQLSIFSCVEKEAMEVYFNFICACFEAYIGKLLTVVEYLQFKDYYNRLMLKRISLEEKQVADYYRALRLADSYMEYMRGYDLSVSDDRGEIIKNIASEKNLNYLGDLQIILDNHVICSEAKEKIQQLQEEIQYFHGKQEEAEDIEELPIDFLGAKVIIQFLKDEKVVDEASFTSENLEQAVYDYLARKAEVKKIGIDRNGERVFLFTCKNGSISMPVINRKMKENWSEADRDYYEVVEEKIANKILKLGGTEDENGTY